MLKTFTLPSGLKVVTYNLPQLRSIFLELTTKGGAIIEPQGKNGVAHLMEHMILQGTPSYPTADLLAKYIESLSGAYNAQTSAFEVAYHVSLPSNHLEDGLRLMSEIFYEPIFDQAALEKEKNAVIEELRQRMDSKFFKINQFYSRSLYGPDHPLIKQVGGNLKIVPKLTRDDITKYWQSCFLPENGYLVVVGNFSESLLLEKLETYFNKSVLGHKLVKLPSIANQNLNGQEVKLRTDKTLKSNYLDLNFPSLNDLEPIKLKLTQAIAVSILSNLRNSRLHRLLRTDRGLVYSVHASAYHTLDLGHVNISSEVVLENFWEVIELIIQELRSFASLGPTEEEVNFAKNYLTNRWLMSFDHPSAIAEWIKNGLVWEEKILLPEEFSETISKVTASDVLDLIKSYWDFDQIKLIVQGPVANNDSNRQKMTKLLKDLNHG